MAKKLKKREVGNSGASSRIIAFWNENKTWGDYQRIADHTNLSRPTISRAFDGDATSDVCEKITDYYLKKTGAVENTEAL